MTVLVTTRIPGLPAEAYDQVADQLASPLRDAPGFVAHAAAVDVDGVVVTELWEGREEWQRFFDANVKPNLPESLPSPQCVEIRKTILR